MSGIYRPQGYIVLAEAVDILGKSLFGSEWTGTELLARKLGACSFPDPSELEADLDSCTEDEEEEVEGFPSRPPRWRVNSMLGQQLVQTEEEALEIWEKERPKLIDMWRKETAARERFDAVALEIRQILNVGKIHSWAHRTKIGDLVPVPAHVWGRDDIPGVFKLEDSEQNWRNPNVIEFYAEIGTYGSPVNVRGCVLLSEDEIRAGLSVDGEQPVEPFENGGNEKPRSADQSARIKVGSVESLAPVAPNYLRALAAHDTWTLTKALYLIHGSQPPDGESALDLMSHFHDAYLLAVNSIESGTIAREITKAGKRQFIAPPADWLAWADGKGLPVAENVREAVMASPGKGYEPTPLPVVFEEKPDLRDWFRAPAHSLEDCILYLMNVHRKQMADSGTNRDEFDRLRNLAMGAIVGGQLRAKEVGGVYWIKRQAFVGWAQYSGLYPENIDSLIDDADETSNQTRPVRRFSKSAVRDWYEDRVRNWPANAKSPSREDDWEAAKTEINENVTRGFVRELRNELAPEWWRTMGRRKSGGRKTGDE